MTEKEVHPYILSEEAPLTLIVFPSMGPADNLPFLPVPEKATEDITLGEYEEWKRMHIENQTPEKWAEFHTKALELGNITEDETLENFAESQKKSVANGLKRFDNILDSIRRLNPEVEITDKTPMRFIMERIEDAFKRLIEIQQGEAAKKVSRRALPNKLKQPTFYEMKHLTTAVSDGAGLRRWSDVSGEVALVHAIEGAGVQIKFAATPELNFWGVTMLTHDHLREHLRTLEPRGVLLFQIVLAWALEDDRVRVTLDDLIKLVGWTPRSTAEREKMRGKVWRWLNMFAAMPVIGARPGVYKDKLTKQKINLTSRDPFIVFTGRRDEPNQQMRLDNSQPPVEVAWAAGEWFKTVRDNPQVLSHFGDVLKLTGLPTGKASGAWALSLGLALNQLWRERAKGAHVTGAGDENRLTVRFESFTREELLDLFRLEEFWVEDVLKSKDPKRAQKYWRDAIKLLEKSGMIGYYKELESLPDSRQGWADFWLRKQRLDIRPKAAEMQDAADIARAAQAYNRSGSRARRKPKGAAK